MNITNVGTPNIKENKNDRLHLKSEMEGNAQKNSLFVTCKLQAQMELLRHFYFQEVVTLTLGDGRGEENWYLCYHAFVSTSFVHDICSIQTEWKAGVEPS